MQTQFSLLPHEILMNILSYVIGSGDDDTMNDLITRKDLIKFMATFQSLSHDINSNKEMMQYFDDFWIRIAKKYFIFGLNSDELLRLIEYNNPKQGQKRKLLLALCAKNLVFNKREGFAPKEVAACNIVVLGGGGVGKSSLAVRYVTDVFVNEYDPTIEDSFRKKVDIGGLSVVLDIIDTAGQEEHGPNFQETHHIMRGDCFVIVCSVIDQKSANQMREICENILRTRDENNMPIIFAINKVDLVDHSDRFKICKEIENDINSMKNLYYLSNTSTIECSAKSKENVNAIFEECAVKKFYGNLDYANILENVIKYDSNYLKTITNVKEQTKKPSNCLIN